MKTTHKRRSELQRSDRLFSLFAIKNTNKSRFDIMLVMRLTSSSRRLLPLYIAAFLQGVPFWYAIEKLFMLDIGFNTASIGMMVAIMSAVMLAVETPSGILADRWSRKGVMLLGCLSLLICAITGALSFNEPMYIVSTVFWGVYFALYSGTYDAVIYDTVMEEHGDSKKFQQLLGRFKAVEGVAFVIGALCGGLIASAIGMRETYVISLPFILLAFVFLWRFREPQLHKAEVSVTINRHIRQTFASVLKNPVILPVVIALVGFVILQEVILELSQIWFIAVAAPLVLYGVFSAIVFSSWSLGGILSEKIKMNSSIILTIAVTIVAILGLIFTRDYWIILASQFILATCFIALGVVLSKKMHDELPSKLRAGAASVVSTLARLLLIPSALLFTTLANNYNVFSASYMLLAIGIIASVALLFSMYSKSIAPRH